MYIVEKFDIVTYSWNYMNSFKTFSEACEAREYMGKRFPGLYRIKESF